MQKLSRSRVSKTSLSRQSAVVTVVEEDNTAPMLELQPEQAHAANACSKPTAEESEPRQDVDADTHQHREGTEEQGTSKEDKDNVELKEPIENEKVTAEEDEQPSGEGNDVLASSEGKLLPQQLAQQTSLRESVGSLDSHIFDQSLSLSMNITASVLAQFPVSIMEKMNVQEAAGSMGVPENHHAEAESDSEEHEDADMPLPPDWLAVELLTARQVDKELSPDIVPVKDIAAINTELMDVGTADPGDGIEKLTFEATASHAVNELSTVEEKGERNKHRIHGVGDLDTQQQQPTGETSWYSQHVICQVCAFC